MPAFFFKCRHCVYTKRFFVSKIGDVDVKCPECSGELAWAPKGVTSQVMERIDNGLMPRAVERLANAEEIHYEHSLHGREPDVDEEQ